VRRPSAPHPPGSRSAPEDPSRVHVQTERSPRQGRGSADPSRAPASSSLRRCPGQLPGEAVRHILDAGAWARISDARLRAPASERRKAAPSASGCPAASRCSIAGSWKTIPIARRIASRSVTQIPPRTLATPDGRRPQGRQVEKSVVFPARSGPTARHLPPFERQSTPRSASTCHSASSPPSRPRPAAVSALVTALPARGRL